MRDRRSLAVMFGIPLVLYPLMTIAMARMGSARFRQLTEVPAKVIVINPGGAPHLIEMLDTQGSDVMQVRAEDPTRALQKNEADAVLVIPDNLEKDALAGKATADLVIKLDRSRNSAQYADNKLK